ncbi:MAG: VOC family protein [Xanthomonadales bacterium]|nr:VOC family protein [Xanthomonadales bacterium]
MLHRLLSLRMAILMLAPMVLLAFTASAESPNQIDIDLKRPAITVGDLDRSISFYTEVLGLTLDYQDERFIPVPNRFDLQILGLPPDSLRRVAILSTSSEPRGFVLQAFDPPPTISTRGELLLVFRSNDLDALETRLRQSGVTVLQPGSNQSSRFREIGIRDPDGHAITVYMLPR